MTYAIPSCLKAGYYLVRHEIIALHAAYEYPGAQFYPGCRQLKVSGSGSTTPSGLFSFPGAYKGSDPGITYDAYQGWSYNAMIAMFIGLICRSTHVLCTRSPDQKSFRAERISTTQTRKVLMWRSVEDSVVSFFVNVLHHTRLATNPGPWSTITI